MNIHYTEQGVRCQFICAHTFPLVEDAWSFHSLLEAHQFHRHLYNLHNDKHKNMQDHMNVL